MTQSSASGSENDVDRKLDSLISRIQSLSGNDEAQRPKQQPRLASGSAPGAAPGSSPGQSSGPAAARPSISRPVAAAGSSGGGAGSVSGGISPGVSGSAAGPNPGGPRPRPAGQPPQAGRHPATAAAKKDRTPYGFTPTRDEPWRPLEPEDVLPRVSTNPFWKRSCIASWPTSANRKAAKLPIRSSCRSAWSSRC